MAYLAKSKPVQTLWEHTEEVLKLWKKMIGIYGIHFTEKEKKIIYWAGYYHDIGKINPHFQAKLHRLLNLSYKKIDEDIAQIPHGFLSCAYMDMEKMEEEFKGDLERLVMAIFNHHKREDMYTDAQLVDYIENFLPDTYCLDGNIVLERNEGYMDYICEDLRNNNKSSSKISEEEWLRYAVIKGMLNRLDYAASGGKADIEIEPLPLGVLTQSVQNNWSVMRPVQKYMKEHREENLVVLAATGSGKTEAALYWMDGNKCFYTLPLKVSINAICDRIVDVYKYDEKKITLLHSDLLSYYFTRQEVNSSETDDDPLERQGKARLLSYPLTICTVDQLFWFVFKAQGSEIIPATLKYSRVIIDEIQMYSPDILAYLIYGLKLVTQIGCRFAVLTATFPPVFEHFMREEGLDFAPIHEPFMGEYQRRHTIVLRECEFDYEEIAAAGNSKKILVLCNTVSKAQTVYEALKECPNCRLLHSRFIRRDRKILEGAIMDFSKSGKNGIWISTQIVEASLDIDFDLLYTEMCPADSLLQRMGRCYRKRDNDAGEANIYIHNTQNGYGTVYEYKDIFDHSWEFLQQYNGDCFSEQEKFGYIEKVYAVELLKNTKYYEKIKNNLLFLQTLQPLSIDLEKAHKQFRNIQSITILPEIFYQNEHVQSCISILKRKKKHSKEESVKAENMLMDYTVSVDKRLLYDEKRKAYIDSDPIQEIRWMNIHRCTSLYDFDGQSGRGICLEKEAAKERFC